MQKSSSFLAACVLVALSVVFPRTPPLAPPEAPPPAASTDILIVDQPAQTDENELDYILPEDMTSQP